MRLRTFIIVFAFIEIVYHIGVLIFVARNKQAQ